MAILPHSAAHRRRGLYLALVLLLCQPLAVKHSRGAAIRLRLPSPAYRVGGTTMVPLHPIVAWLGAEIHPRQGAATITLTREGHRRKVEVRPGSTSILIDGRPARLPRPASSARDEIYAPLEILPLAFHVTSARIPDQPDLLLHDGAREAVVPVMPPRYPIVVADGRYLLGGTENGKWIDAGRMAPLLRGGERYWLYAPSRYLGTAMGARPTEELHGPYHSVRLSPEPAKTEQAIAVGGPWNALPRRPVTLSPASAVYRQAVRDILRQNGLPRATVRIIQVVRIDLEGDGTDEVILSARAPGMDRPQTYVRANDYSLVALRKLLDGQVKTFLLGASFYKTPEKPAAPCLYTLSSILDLDGDGVLEILVADAFYEGKGMVIYQMQSGKPVAVLNAGFGA